MPDIYDELGVKKVINGHATVTFLGGSLMPEQVTAAMAEAARNYVDIDELQKKAGQRIAEWTHNDAAYVSCGAAAGLVLSTAACITGLDPEKRSRLPFTEGMKNEVIVHKKGRVSYDFAVRQAGGVIVEIGSEDGAGAIDLEEAINERTVEILYFFNPTTMKGQIPLEKGIEIANSHGVPVVVDAAAQIPPVENLWRFTQMGASLALFSGGKGLRGPQSSGLILGNPDLIDACSFNACPRPFIGRPMKAGKEEIVGLMTAVRWYLDLDQQKQMALYERQVQYVIEALAAMDAIAVERNFPNEAGQPMPRAEIRLDEKALGFTRDDLLAKLKSGTPGIVLAPAGANGVFVNPQTLAPGQEVIIARRIDDILRATG
ncbi:MAG: hypothetical protein CMN78_02335 [Spirochaetales bacterium]|nr:hypothetical protein [Spirochaetales bacterium]